MTPTQQLVKWQSHNLIPGLSDSKTFSLHIVLLDGNHLPGRNDLISTSKPLRSD